MEEPDKQTIGNKIIYKLKDISDWDGVEADLAITDPPFGLEYDGKSGNYNRDTSRVVDGYIDWDSKKYSQNINTLLDVIQRNTVGDGQAIVFSGKDHSHRVHQTILDQDEWILEGKLYWAYNFAPYCTKRPTHNVYELYWMVKGEDWYYTNECQYDHCQEGEANLSVLDIPREYLREMPKYPTRLPPQVAKVLLSHFSEARDTVFDPLAGAGTVGIAAAQQNRESVLGDRNTEAKDVFGKTRDALKT